MICTAAKHFPLAIVYGGQTWAAYTEGWSICFTHMGGIQGECWCSIGESVGNEKELTLVCFGRYDTGNTRFRDIWDGSVELYHGSLSGPWVAIE